MILEPKPFLRWAGGKRRVIPYIFQNLPRDFNSGKTRVYEPFLGGGAFIFSLFNPTSPFFTPGKNLVISDINQDLITAYIAVRDRPDELIKKVDQFAKKKTKKEFEDMRSLRPRNDLEAAARFIYLNKTCFNGLWRVNSKGEFNVPWGKLKDPQIIDITNIRECHRRLRNSTIMKQDFASSLESCRRGDFVYLDPPYLPLNSSSNFSKYSKEDFGLVQHAALAGAINALTKKGVKVLLSNSDTPLTREIYASVLKIKSIHVQRSISAKSESRVQVKEIIGTNY